MHISLHIDQVVDFLTECKLLHKVLSREKGLVFSTRKIREKNKAERKAQNHVSFECPENNEKYLFLTFQD